MSEDKKSTPPPPKGSTVAESGKDICGVIMPISATAAHDEAHWSDIQTILHRAITKAGLNPKNVWEGSSVDRVSERIIAGIYSADFVVADITDLNPNVMFELGLRLASKRPTIVVAEIGSPIPFDIRDFHVTFYPKGLGIIKTERFVEELSTLISHVSKASKDGDYTPFLGSVVIDVIAPSEEIATVDQLILERLDELGRRIDTIDRPKTPVQSRSTPSRVRKDRVIRNFVPSKDSTTYFVGIPSERVGEFLKEAGKIDADSVEKFNSEDGIEYFSVLRKGSFEVEERLKFVEFLESAVRRFGGDTGAPFYYDG